MRSVVVAGGLVLLALLGCDSRAGSVGSAAQEDASKPEFYTTRVRPILREYCDRCHGAMNHRGGLSMSTREGMLKGGHSGAVVIPGDPEKSLLVQLIRHEYPAQDPRPMPPKGAKLSDADIAIVERWVKAGAIMPVDEDR
jgi:cytochrome c